MFVNLVTAGLDLARGISWVPFLTLDTTGTVAILGGALALGIRHGIDWDHIAAITDITSTSATADKTDQSWLTAEPGIQFTDESHHDHVHRAPRPARATDHTMDIPRVTAGSRVRGVFREHQQPFMLGTLYALGHGSMVIGLGLLAILFSGFLPDWIDPIMERVVGVTLVFLGLYLSYSLYRFFRSGEQFRMRSRWMLVFAVAGRGYRAALAKLGLREHNHVHAEETQQYGARTAYGIGLIHGIGAETGTQVLIIGSAVGAASKGMGVATLFVFVFGIIISNSIVTIATTTGFISSQRRQYIYVAVGAIAAVFSLLVGTLFLLQAGDNLPNLDRYFTWIGGPSSD